MYEKILVVWKNWDGKKERQVIIAAENDDVFCFEDCIVGSWPASKAEYEAFKRAEKDNMRHYLVREGKEIYDDCFGDPHVVGYCPNPNRHQRKKARENPNLWNFFWHQIWGDEEEDW